MDYKFENKKKNGKIFLLTINRFMIQNKNAYKYILKSCFIIRLILLIYANANLTLINFKIIIKKVQDRK